jgi:hypothetical protein
MATATEIDHVEIEHFVVRANHEWATVVLRFGERDGRYWGTLLVDSSFGAYGHTWTHCGEPFPAFLADIDADYLLGKISTRVLDEKKMVESIRRTLLRMRRDNQISAEQAREAWTCVTECYGNYDGPVLANQLYEAAEMPTEFDWCEISTQDWPQQAKAFARKLWPAIVERIGK